MCPIHGAIDCNFFDVLYFSNENDLQTPILKKYRRYSTISRGFFQKNLTDKMNGLIDGSIKKNKFSSKSSKFSTSTYTRGRLILEVDL